MKITQSILIGTSAMALSLMSVAANAQTFDIRSATGSGSHANYPPSNVLNGNLNFASRWAGNGSPEEIRLDLGQDQRVDDVRIAWGRGDTRSYTFEVAGRSGTSGNWTTVFSGTSSGDTAGFENYNVNDITARQIRIRGLSNSRGSAWTDITGVEIIGTGGPGGSSPTPAPTPTPSPTPSGGVNVPARIQAEDFTNFRDTSSGNNGGQYRNTNVDIQNTSDAGGGHNIGWTTAGEWLEYEIDVDNAGTYEVGLRLATRTSGNRINVQVDGNNRTGNVTVNNTGNWQNFYTETVNLGNLSAGRHTVRVNFVDGRLNFNWIDINRSGSNPAPTPEPTPTPTPVGGFGLDPNAHPWENFDLRFWKIDTPAGESSSSDCDAQDTEPYEWNSLPSSRSDEFFFTHTDGGMRFVSEIGGGTTGGSCNSRPRSELREMLRGSNRSIDTTGKNGDFRNNWALGYQPRNHSGNSGESWGAREGKMSATLRVNKVTTSGKDSSRGRTVIGQIHADNDEPLRLNYKHRAGHRGGCIYASSEKRGGSDVNFILAGSNTSCSQDPGNNGLGLGELFSYEIENDGEDIIVTIREGDRGAIINRAVIDLNQLNSGYDRSDDWMYFKAGAYTQNSLNDDGNRGDTDIVTFYRLDVEH